MQKLSLVVSHLIHLTREQRAAIEEGKIIQRYGISVPAWYSHPVNSDPVYEIVVSYRIGLSNYARNIRVDVSKDGYDIYLPGAGKKSRKTRNIFPSGGGYLEDFTNGKLTIHDEKVFIGHVVSLRPLPLLESKIENQVDYHS